MTGPASGEPGLYWRLSTFYFLYYGAVGIFVPYWPVYLSHAGYSPVWVGAAFAVLGAMRIGTPLFWGWVMDRSGARMRIISLTMLACCAIYALIPFAPSTAAMLLLHAAYAIFWNAALPAFDVVTLHSIHRTSLDYSRIRLWGSVGFIVSVMLYGVLLDHVSMAIVPASIIACMLAMAALGMSLRDPQAHTEESTDGRRSLRQVLARPAVWALLAAAFLSQFSFAPFYSFFSIYLGEAGYSSALTGQFWALGVAAEVVVFWYASVLIRRFGAWSVLLLALATTVLRWWLLASFVEVAALLSLSQILHFSSFGLYHTATVVCVHRLFPRHLHGRGQALLAGLSFGLGGSLGSLLAGRYWEAAGGEIVYLAAAIAAAMGLVVVWRGLRAPELMPERGPAAA